MNTPGVSRFGGAGQWKKSMQSGDGLIFLGFIPPSHARVCLTTTSLRFFFLYFGDSDQGWIIKARAKASGPLFKILIVALSLIVLQRTQRQTIACPQRKTLDFCGQTVYSLTTCKMADVWLPGKTDCFPGTAAKQLYRKYAKSTALVY